VCTAGSRESHLAILSRESDVPCVLTGDVADGDTVVLDLTDPQTARLFESELFGMNTYILMSVAS
jgi:phosphoenolpyruvate-protein kinase (PTS system EI component)